MTQFSISRSFSNLAELAPIWDGFVMREPKFFPSFSETKANIEGADYLVVIAKDNSCVTAIACFLNGDSKKHFTIGERRLFTLPVRETVLFGSSVLGCEDRDTIATMIKFGISEWDFDLVNLGEIIVGSPLHVAASTLGGGMIATRRARKDSIRWLIRLPQSFESYLNSLSSVTRQGTIRKLKKIEREFPVEFHVISRSEQVAKFLSDGEKISRLTYQWNVGQRLCDDEPTRRRYLRLANEGRLRCYSLYIGGQPTAFLRGEISNRFYHYETPGFDPQFEKASPGTVLLMWAIRDLIDNTDCEVFDFGIGGDDRGYKSHYGNISINCTSLELSRWYRPYSLVLAALQGTLSLAKNIASASVGTRSLQQRIKKAARKFGD